ncbi:DUF952 domain-containing protein [Flaviflagellibacter deserti]|uniref:DUF952 domain-containing protein n=1 Tax=Flaviflagellibacter deserti TaxID=2267266 RepID=A0ABV9Z025_9HYPH
MIETIYKILPAEMWEQACREGLFRGAPVDIADGFIHFSTAEQVAETAARHFAGQADLILLAVDTTALDAALKWEPSRGGALFPHLYNDMDVSAVRWAKPLPWNGTHHVFPELGQ